MPGTATCTVTRNNDGISTIDKYQIAFVGDAASGAFPSFTFSAPVTGYLRRVVRTPGTTAPDASNTTYVYDENGADLLDAKMKGNGVAAASDQVILEAAINDALVVTLADNTTASAEITITLYIDTITATPRAA